MPYKSVSELNPKTKKAIKSVKGRRTFMKAFNSAYKTYGGDEEKCFKVAYSAAKKGKR